MSKTLIMYVDGFNLYHGLHTWARCKWLWLDLVALGESLRRQDTLLQVHYFTAPVLNDPAAQSRQQRYQDALVAHSGAKVNIIQGRYQAKQQVCRKCGHAYTKYEEKETDVNIAAHLVTDAAQGASDAALLVSADSDLVPAVRAAKKVNPGLFVACAFPPERASHDLRTLMPASFQMGKGRVRQAQLPSTVTGPTGLTYQRPSKWS